MTARDVRFGAVTVSTSEGDVTPFRAAVTLAVPTATPVARPPALMVAAAVLSLAQVAVAVMSAVVLSEYVAVAVNCCVNPAATEGEAGVTAIEETTGAVTVSTS